MVQRRFGRRFNMDSVWIWSKSMLTAASEGAIFAGPVGTRPRILNSGDWPIARGIETTLFLREIGPRRNPAPAPIKPETTGCRKKISFDAHPHSRYAGREKSTPSSEVEC